jgi:hypothetical protein
MYGMSVVVVVVVTVPQTALAEGGLAVLIDPGGA